MILALVLATTIEGPTVRAPRPKDTLRAQDGDTLPLKQPVKRQGEWASLLDAHPETEVQRGGSPMIPVSVHLRGARSHHLTLTRHAHKTERDHHINNEQRQQCHRLHRREARTNGSGAAGESGA